MIYFYQRAGDRRTCETRLEPHGPRFELIVVDGRNSRVEHFDDATALASRQYELRRSWMLNGWRTLDSDDEYDDSE